MEKWRFCRKVSSSCTDLFFLLLCLPMFLFYFSSCDNEEGYLKGHGTVYLQLQADTTFAASGKTKATDGFDEFKNVSNYSVEISQGEKVVTSYEKYSDMPTSIDLESGTYQLKAFLGELLPAKFEAPYFAGTTKFQVEANKKTSASVTCALANTKVSVSYSDDFKEAYPDYSLSMTTAHTSEALVFKKDETRSAYFQADSTGQKLNMSMSLTSLENKKTTFTPSAITIKPREDVKLLFKTDGEAVSGVKLEITIDGSTADTTVNVGIPDYMLPLEPPLITPKGFESGKLYTVASGDEVAGAAWDIYEKNGSIDIFAGGAIDSCIMTVNSPYLKAKGLTKERYDLANLSDEDAGLLKSLDLEWNESMKYKQSVKCAVNLANLLWKQIQKSDLGTVHEFTFQVKDSLKQHQESNKVILKVERRDPIINITMGGGDVWATKAYLKANVVSGNPASVKFEIKKGNIWMDFNRAGYVTSYSIEGQYRVMEVLGLSSSTKYLIRASYGGRDVYSDEYEFETEAKDQLPNVGFEDWTKKIVQAENSIPGFGTVFPEIAGWYPYTGSQASWFSTNEQTVFSDRTIHNGSYQSYLLYPSVEKVTDFSEGVAAAKISTVGWGEPTLKTNSQGIEEPVDCEFITPGRLYLAIGKEQNNGVKFTSRPSALSFDYKYKPLSGDSFKVRLAILSGDVEIGYTELVSGQTVNNYMHKSLPIVYYDQYRDLKATNICLEFLSSTQGNNAKVERIQIPTILTYFFKFVGSSLYIDNINLEY